MNSGIVEAIEREGFIRATGDSYKYCYSVSFGAIPNVQIFFSLCCPSRALPTLQYSRLGLSQLGLSGVETCSIREPV